MPIKPIPHRKFNLFRKKNTLANMLLLLFIIVIKNGVHPIGPEWIDWVRSAGNSLPSYESYLSKSILPSVLSRSLPDSNYSSWWIFYGLILIIWILVVFRWLDTHHRKNTSNLKILFFMLPSTATQFLYLGHYDIFIFVFSTIAVVAKRFIIVSLASLFCVLTNPEMTLVIGFNLTLVAIFAKSRNISVVSLYFVFVSLATIILEKIFFSESKPDRASINLDLWLPSFKVSMPIWQLHVWAMVSPVLLGLVTYFSGALVRKDWFLIIPCFLVPIFFSMAIVDGTRVGASIGTSALIASILHIDSRSPNRELAEKLDLKLLMLLVLVPFIAVDVGGELRLPYQMLFNLLFNSA